MATSSPRSSPPLQISPRTLSFGQIHPSHLYTLPVTVRLALPPDTHPSTRFHLLTYRHIPQFIVHIYLGNLLTLVGIRPLGHSSTTSRNRSFWGFELQIGICVGDDETTDETAEPPHPLEEGDRIEDVLLVHMHTPNHSQSSPSSSPIRQIEIPNEGDGMSIVPIRAIICRNTYRIGESLEMMRQTMFENRNRMITGTTTGGSSDFEEFDFMTLTPSPTATRSRGGKQKKKKKKLSGQETESEPEPESEPVRLLASNVSRQDVKENWSVLNEDYYGHHQGHGHGGVDGDIDMDQKGSGSSESSTYSNFKLEELSEGKGSVLTLVLPPDAIWKGMSASEAGEGEDIDSEEKQEQEKEQEKDKEEEEEEGEQTDDGWIDKYLENLRLKTEKYGVWSAARTIVKRSFVEIVRERQRGQEKVLREEGKEGEGEEDGDSTMSVSRSRSRSAPQQMIENIVCLKAFLTRLNHLKQSALARSYVQPDNDALESAQAELRSFLTRMSSKVSPIDGSLKLPLLMCLPVIVEEDLLGIDDFVDCFRSVGLVSVGKPKIVSLETLDEGRKDNVLRSFHAPRYAVSSGVCQGIASFCAFLGMERDRSGSFLVEASLSGTSGLLLPAGSFGCPDRLGFVTRDMQDLLFFAGRLLSLSDSDVELRETPTIGCPRNPFFQGVDSMVDEVTSRFVQSVRKSISFSEEDFSRGDLGRYLSENNLDAFLVPTIKSSARRRQASCLMVNGRGFENVAEVLRASAHQLADSGLFVLCFPVGIHPVNGLPISMSLVSSSFGKLRLLYRSVILQALMHLHL